MSRSVELWKELGVARAEFGFNCGGDDMGETTLNIYDDKDELIENNELEGILDSQVYQNIEFYQNSDGHYEGESGTVFITLNDEGDDLEFVKDGTGEFNETNLDTLQVELTPEMVKFIQDNVLNMNGDNTNIVVNYKRDFIMTDEQQLLQTELEELIKEKTNDFTPNVDGELNDWFSFTTNDEGEELTFEDNLLNIQMSNSYTVYREDYF